MRSGDVYTGPDGTIYLVIAARDVARDRPRWWIGRAWRRCQSRWYSAGPDSPRDLHLEATCDGDALALVLP